MRRATVRTPGSRQRRSGFGPAPPADPPQERHLDQDLRRPADEHQDGPRGHGPEDPVGPVPAERQHEQPADDRDHVERRRRQRGDEEAPVGVEHPHRDRRHRDQRQEREHDAREPDRERRASGRRLRARSRRRRRVRTRSPARRSRSSRGAGSPAPAARPGTRAPRPRARARAVKVGTKAEASAPSAKKSRSRLGIRNARTNALASQPAPIRAAKIDSRSRPATRDPPVARETRLAGRATLSRDRGACSGDSTS